MKRACISPVASILETIQTLDREGLQIGLVVDEAGVLLGTVTDGDVRRGLLRGLPLTSRVTEVMNREPKTIAETVGRKETIRMMQNLKLRHLPVVDEYRRIIRVEVLDELLTPERRPNPVLIMAGGQGTRLRPLTEDCPKPLLNVGGQPILETILTHLADFGFHEFHIAIHYRGDMIRDYFGNGSKWGLNIQYLEENEQLGTAGAISLLPKPTSPYPVLVMNGDLLTKMNFGQLMDFHAEHQSVATMCIREFDFRVPYGVVRLQDEALLSIDEKPVHKFFVNAGIYVVDPEVYSGVEKGVRVDMPDLFRKAIENKKKVSAFPIREYWLDIGQPDDFARANGEFTQFFKGPKDPESD